MTRVLGREGELGIQWMPGGSTNYKCVGRERRREREKEGGKCASSVSSLAVLFPFSPSFRLYNKRLGAEKHSVFVKHAKDFVRGFTEFAPLSRDRVWYEAEGIKELSKVRLNSLILSHPSSFPPLLHPSLPPSLFSPLAHSGGTKYPKL